MSNYEDEQSEKEKLKKLEEDERFEKEKLKQEEEEIRLEKEKLKKLEEEERLEKEKLKKLEDEERFEKEKLKEHPIEYIVNDEILWTKERELTPVQIMTNAQINPQENYLIEVKGLEQILFKDDPNKEIKMHDHMKFTTVYTGVVPVSGNN